jgi:hypothetical protein
VYKIRPEISSFGPLAPRHFMTQHSFKKITSDRIKKLGSKFCEACNEKYLRYYCSNVQDFFRLRFPKNDGTSSNNGFNPLKRE